MGGFAKDTTPFSEFLWADFLRRKLSRKAVDANFDKALEKAMAAAKSKDAIYLPGWCGPAEMIRRNARISTACGPQTGSHHSLLSEIIFRPTKPC